MAAKNAAFLFPMRLILSAAIESAVVSLVVFDFEEGPMFADSICEATGASRLRRGWTTLGETVEVETSITVNFMLSGG